MMSALDARVMHAPARPGFSTKLATVFSDWISARATRKALDRLSDRELDDIGLCRGDIDRVAHGR